MLSILLWIILPATLIIVGTVCVIIDRFNNWRSLLNVVGSILLFISMLIWLTSYVEVIKEIKEFESVRSTIELSRANPNVSDYERAALIHKIVDANKWLAAQQYWGSMLALDLFYPDKIHGLKPIR